MLVLAAGWCFGGLENVGTVDFRRNLNFKREFSFLLTKRLVGFLVTACAAVAFRSYWALVAGTVIGRLAGVLLSYAMHPYRPRPSLGATRELFSFSGWMLANNAVLVAIVRFPHFLIGRLYGSGALGLFTIAYEFATLPVTELASPMNRALLPAYSRLALHPRELRETFLDMAALVMTVALPASVGIAVLAEPIVRLVLGAAWIEAVPLMRVLALSAAFIAVQTQNGLLLIALGVPKLNTAVSVGRLAVLVPLAYYRPLGDGVLGIAWAELVASGACLLISYPYIMRRLEIDVPMYAGRIWRPIVASLAMGAGILPLIKDGGHDLTTVHFLRQVAIGIPSGVAWSVSPLLANTQPRPPAGVSRSGRRASQISRQ
jgi:O-antigen/teichoic acid export membrane protein